MGKDMLIYSKHTVLQSWNDPKRFFWSSITVQIFHLSFDATQIDVKSKVEDGSNFVAFSEDLNFIKKPRKKYFCAFLKTISRENVSTRNFIFLEKKHNFIE